MGGWKSKGAVPTVNINSLLGNCFWGGQPLKLPLINDTSTTKIQMRQSIVHGFYTDTGS
jgi:hypothetical protein